MLVWKDIPATGNLQAGKYYLVVYHVPFAINSIFQGLLTDAIKLADGLQNLSVQQVNYVSLTDSQGKAAGTDIKITIRAQ